MAKKTDFEKGTFNTGSVNLGDFTPENTPPENGKKGGGFTLSSVTPTIKRPYHVSGHNLLWKYEMQGSPNRGIFRSVKMRGWEKRIWRFMGCTVTANKKTLEIHTHRPKTRNLSRLLSFAWLKVDNARRAFSTWQQIGLKEVPSPHPLALQIAHLVTEEKPINRFLVAAIRANLAQEDRRGVGLTTDESHAGKAEMAGRMSAEGMKGAEFVFLQLPEEWGEMKAAIGLLEGENRALAQGVAKIALFLQKR